MKLSKKGAYGLEDLGMIAMTLVGSVIVIAFGAKVLNEMGDEFTVNSTEYNVVQNGSEALLTLGKWTPTIALIAVAAIILGLVFTALYFGGK